MKRKMNRIKEVLDEQGRTQTWLAKQINRTTAATNAICQNRSQPSLKLIFQIAEILQVSAKELIGDGSEISEK